jgi:hypothetical protein
MPTYMSHGSPRPLYHRSDDKRITFVSGECVTTDQRDVDKLEWLIAKGEPLTRVSDDPPVSA